MRNARLWGITALLVSFGLATRAEASVWEVNAGAGCPGSGTSGAPFCAIGGAAAVAVAGDTVNVAPGVYREQVTPANSGAAGLPITYVASGTGAKVLGTNDLSGATWTPATATAFSTPFNPTTNTAQVFVDGVRLTPVASVAALVANSFFFDTSPTLPNPDVLYVDIGGSSPSGRAVEAGARSFGFDVAGRNHIVIQGFEVAGQNSSAIRVRNSGDVAVRDNLTAQADDFGILVETTTGPVEVSGNQAFENHGGGLRTRIASTFTTGVVGATFRNNVSHHNGNHGLLAVATSGSLFAGNEFFDNLRPTGVSTTGLILDGDSDGNVVERNLSHHNQDSGFQVSGGSDNNVLVRNISHSNGDHGFDVGEGTGTRLISNTSWGNTNDGFSLERPGTADTTLANNIGTGNGGFDLFVRQDAVMGGFASDYDVFFSDATPISFDGVTYASVATFGRATGHEDHGIGADPLFVDPEEGDFHPGIGPWLDSADASITGFQAPDFDGLPPLDLPRVRNTGAGVPNFADRGALEFRESTSTTTTTTSTSTTTSTTTTSTTATTATSTTTTTTTSTTTTTIPRPQARLTLTPKKTQPGLVVTADGSGSSGAILNYHFDWGDGTPPIDQVGPRATHTFALKGNYHVRLTVTDLAGRTASQEKLVQVR